jgi:glycosyltransferase involved in cell wall biosynthesis
MKIAVIYPTLAMPRQIDVENLATDPRGLTGSENTALQYALVLARLGHEVVMYTNVTTDKIELNGVVFRHDQAWEPSHASFFDGIVCFMNATPLMGTTGEAFRIFNMQCGDFGGQPIGWEQYVDALGVLSHIHAREMKPTTALPADKWRVMYNGVDMGAFMPGVKVPGRCIWASSHDRGLHHVLEIWPHVRAEFPHAELHVFYDPQGLERFAKMGPTDVPFLNELKRRSIYELEMMVRLKYHGVFFRGSVSREQMRLEMARAEVLAYPCDPVRFTETCGVTVLEAMAAECVPVLCYADSFPELWETRGCPGVPWPYERDAYLAKLIEVMRGPEKYAASIRGRAADFEWATLGKKLELAIASRGVHGLERAEFTSETPVDYVKYQPFMERAA